MIGSSLGVLTLLMVVAGQTDTAAIYSSSAQTIEVEALPDLFQEESVEENLTTGLSTTLIANASYKDSDGTNHLTEARARIRYDLWDEVFLVDSYGFGKDGSFRLTDHAALLSWWRDSSLTLELDHEPKRLENLRLRVVVLPFSQTEEDDARLWFSRSVGRAGTRGPGSRPSEINSFLEQVMATSIRREKLLSYDLKVSIATKR